MDVKTVGAAVRVTVAFMASVTSFAGIIGFFGGGLQGLVTAALVAFAVFVGALFLLRRSMTTPTEPAERSAARPLETTGVRETRTEVDSRIRTSGRVCDLGPYEVEGADVRWIQLDVRKDERVRGRLSERYGDDFDWYIVDERNLVLLQNGGKFSSIQSGDHVSADTVRWSVARDGPWFLVIDLYGRSNERLIEVDLRRY